MAHIPRGIRQTCAALAVTATASGDVVFDQIGPHDGTSLNGGYVISQHLNYNGLPNWDIAAVAGFALDTEITLTDIEFVLTGSPNFQGPSVVTDYEINVYSDLEAATSNLIGDILSTSLTAVVDDTWTGQGTLLGATLDTTLDAGNYYLSVMMTVSTLGIANPGIATTSLDEGQNWMISPGDKYPWSPGLHLSEGLAYRLQGSPVPSPGAWALVVCAVLMSDTRRRRQ